MKIRIPPKQFACGIGLVENDEGFTHLSYDSVEGYTTYLP